MKTRKKKKKKETERVISGLVKLQSRTMRIINHEPRTLEVQVILLVLVNIINYDTIKMNATSSKRPGRIRAASIA